MEIVCVKLWSYFDWGFLWQKLIKYRRDVDKFLLQEDYFGDSVKKSLGNYFQFMFEFLLVIMVVLLGCIEKNIRYIVCIIFVWVFYFRNGNILSCQKLLYSMDVEIFYFG